MTVHGVSESGSGDHSGQFAVAVNGLTAPGPRIDFGVVIVQSQLDVHPADAFLFLTDERLLADEVDVTVELDAESAAALQRGRRCVDVLTPIGVESFHAQTTRGVVPYVPDVVFPSAFYNLQNQTSKFSLDK